MSTDVAENPPTPTSGDKQTRLRALPAINTLLEHPLAFELEGKYGRDALRDALRETLDMTRQAILAGEQPALEIEELLAHAQRMLGERYAPTLRTVINATGVIVHTNLGRSPLSVEARRAVGAVAHQYNTLEFNLDTGKRGSRYVHAEQALCEITGAEAALVVNNNAAALVLLLAELARGHEVVISRGQLVEIGGGFRIPDIMRQSGATLVEVGTTNRTRISDYAQAITEQTSMLLRIHSSNFRLIGFVEQPTIAEMAQIAHDHDCLLVDDIGSGALMDTTRFGLLPEPTVQASLEAGADLVCFSSDKLLGGPQAGILVGRADVITRLKKHPLARAMRADKLCYAALNATLEHYRRDEVFTHIPIWRMISQEHDALLARAEAWRDQLAQTGISAQCQPAESTVGGGSLPGTNLPTTVLALDVPAPDAFLARLRAYDMPVIARIMEDQVLLDPRTVLPEQDTFVLDAIRYAFA
jgi:L-seryl-tRNA(Ser) seleniumtransferase